MNQQLSAEELQKIAQGQGQRLGIILSELKISDDTRQAILDMIPGLTLEQADELIGILEAKYLDAATQEVDDKLRQDLMQIKQTYDAALEDIHANTMRELDDIEKEIDKLA